MRFIAATDISLWIDLNGNVQTVFLQNHLNRRTAFVFIYPYVLRRIRKSGNQRIPHNLIACYIRMRSAGQGRDLIQIGFSPFDHPRTARRIIASAARQITHGIGPIERVIEAAPTGVGRVQSIACVHNRHHELRTGR